MNKPILKKDRIKFSTFEEFKSFLLEFFPQEREWMAFDDGWAFGESVRKGKVYGYQGYFQKKDLSTPSVHLRYYLRDNSVLVYRYPLAPIEITTLKEFTSFLQNRVSI